ncbi:site-2 protease family protein, partial [Planctomycetota bacterium]
NVELLVRRYGETVPKLIDVELKSPKPDLDGRPYIGITPSLDLVIEELPDPVYSTLSIANAKLKKGDKIVAVDGHDLPDYVAFTRLMATRFDDEITFAVERVNETNGETEQHDISIAPTPMRWLGIGMKMGPIAAVQKDSPAEAAGFEIGDVVVRINGQRVTNGIVVPYQLDRMAGQTVEIVVERKNVGEVTLNPTLRVPALYRTGPPALASLYAAESLGIAFPVANEITEIEPGSPADVSGCRVGDVVTLAEFVPAKGQPKPLIDIPIKEIAFEERPDAWAIVHEKIQFALPDTEVKLTLKQPGSSELKVVDMVPVQSTDWNVHYRGLYMKSENAIYQETDMKTAIGLGFRETKEGLEHVVTVFGKLVGGKISPKNLGGPLTIAAMAGGEASQSPSRLLVFLTMLSANVAVLNFLPIPVLDGGHAMFLIYEAVFRKPLDERLAMGLTTIGFVFILGLMILVLGLDIHRMGTFLFQ